MVTDAGVLSAYDAATGARFYQARIGEGGHGFSASPVAANGRLYFASEDGDIYVVRAGKTFAQEARNTLPEITMATPAIDGNLLIVRTRQAGDRAGHGLRPRHEGSEGNEVHEGKLLACGTS